MYQTVVEPPARRSRLISGTGLFDRFAVVPYSTLTILWTVLAAVCESGIGGSERGTPNLTAASERWIAEWDSRVDELFVGLSSARAADPKSWIARRLAVWPCAVLIIGSMRSTG